MDDLYRDVFDALPAPTLLLRLDGVVVRHSRAAAARFGITPDHAHPVLGQVFDLGRDSAEEILLRCAGTSGTQFVTVSILRGAFVGARTSLRLCGLRPRAGGLPHVVLTESVDEQERFEEHSRLVRSLNAELAIQHRLRDELDAALDAERHLHRELIHRVKNNLSLLAVIARSRRQASDDPGVQVALADVEARLQSIAQVHDILDSQGEIDVVDGAVLVERLCQTLEESVLPPHVALERSLEPVRLHITDATPLTLLLNELVTNALKHAFADRGGVIRIGLRRIGNDRLELRLSDDGVGMEAAQPPGTGSRIVEALVAQMEGQIAVSVCGGTSWTLTFSPIDPDTARRVARAAG